ncbi:fasciclin domain-containing protein [Pelobium manganitolerans]|nr:fasciclin domain-containing protein [Pelobium manganitolerans]
MIRFSRSYYLLLFATSVLMGCKKEFSKFYERPESLGPPIYQQLEQKGNFKHLLSAVDKAGYKPILSETGWWTLFAPTDAAFERFYQENNINGDDALSDSLATAIVKYALVYNAYREDQLSNYQTTDNTVIAEGMAFKRKTAYYDGVNQQGDDVHSKTIATNRNVLSRASGNVFTNNSNYKEGDNNNKYIPYFTDKFLATKNLTAADYTSFYPNASAFNGFSVANAQVDPTYKNVEAENGIIHAVDRVITPLNSLDQYINRNSQYSDFAKLLDSLRYYSVNAYVTHQNQVATGSSDSVYVKGYDGRLAFSANNENYQTPGVSSFINTLAQKESWSMMAPTNAALAAYRAKILGKYNNTFFGSTPASILIDFLNSHMWPDALWPSQFSTNPNYLEENASISINNVVDKKVLSNGIFYGVNEANKANVFRTVYGVPYLDPKASMTYNAFKDLGTGIKAYTLQPGVRQTILVMPDNVLAAAGWRYNESSASGSNTAWGYKSASSSSYSHSPIHKENIMAMISTGVLLTPTAELTSFAGEGIVETKNGAYIKYKNGKIQTSGTLDTGVDLNITSSDNSSINGSVYYVDGLLSFTEKNVGDQIEKLATLYPANYSLFLQLLKDGGTDVYNETTKAVTGVKTGTDYKYTFFIPSNAAITQAVKDGVLSGNTSTGVLKKTKDLRAPDFELIRKFVLYHIVNGESIASDGKKTDSYLTLLQADDGSPTLLSVSNDPGDLTVIGYHNSNAKVIEAASNQLGNRSVIHSINNYLDYNKN